MTSLIRGLYNILPQHKGGVVTIGNFDGVHLGHQALIQQVKERAHALHVPSIVILFEPQPLEFFMPQKKVARLMRWREKFLALAALDVDYVLLLRFNQTLATLSAEDFIRQVLVDGLAVEHVIVGDDFRFGHQRQGDFNYLVQKGLETGFTVESMPSFLIDNERVSSTRVRQLLEQGEHQMAARLLGKPYSMMGRVVHGDKLGRQLGFPTANIYLHRPVTPVHGIYTVRMRGASQQSLPGVANVGTRPTVGGTRSLLEVFLFHFDRDIYGCHVEVEFCEKIRNEEHFENLTLLQNAIANDVAIGQAYFKDKK